VGPLDRVASTVLVHSIGSRFTQALRSVGRRAPWFNAERIGAIVLISLAAGFLAVSISYGLANGAQAAPGTFPTITASFIDVLSVIWLFTAKPLPRAAGEAAGERHITDAANSPLMFDADYELDLNAAGEAGQPEAGTLETDSHPIRLLFVLVWSLVILPFVEVLGMIPVLWIYLTGLLWLVAQLKLLKVALITAIVLVLFGIGAYAGGIYLPDPFGIDSSIYDAAAQIFGR
jgi:hypothetical protein